MTMHHVRATICFVSPDNQWGFAEVVDSETGDKKTWMCHRLGRRDAFATQQGTITYSDAKIAFGPFPQHGDVVVVLAERAPQEGKQYPQAVWTTAEQYDPFIEIAAGNRAAFAEYAREQERLAAKRAELEQKLATRRVELEPQVGPLQKRFAIQDLSPIFNPLKMTRVVVKELGREQMLAETEDGVKVVLPLNVQHLVVINPRGPSITAAPAATPRMLAIGEVAYVRSAYVSILEEDEDLVLKIQANAWISQLQAERVVMTGLTKAQNTLAMKAVEAADTERQRQEAIARSHIKGPKLSPPPKGGMAKALARGR